MKLSEIYSLINSDIYRLGRGSLFLDCILGRNSSLKFLFWLRMSKCDIFPIRIFARFMRVILTRRYGVQIPETCEIGAGFELPHCLSIVFHYNAKLGKNCTVHQFVTLGGVDGKVPIIGDNCFIGSGACIIGNITIGNNVTIGANAVVVKDIPDDATVVGIPARVIHYNNPSRYINNPVLNN